MITPQPNGENSSPANISPPISSLSFCLKQKFSRSIARLDFHLLKSPHKKTEGIQSLTTKYKLRVNLKEIEEGVLKC